ncbi:MAG: ABC transporter ATP-binding protein, partial [Pseudomonadota bacterium]
MTLLRVSSLSVALASGRKHRTVVDQVSFDVDAGETLCIVGESGSGKSMTAKAIINLLPKRAQVDGRIELAGQVLHQEQGSLLRGRDIGMIFQEPMTALNPVLTIGRQLTEASVVVGGVSQQQADKKAVELLDRVGIDNTPARMRQYPHEFSGGMRQRAMIAMAMMMSPKLLIADEPTTELDVTIQAQILALLQTLVNETGMGLILITHDMGVVAETADRV